MRSDKCQAIEVRGFFLRFMLKLVPQCCTCNSIEFFVLESQRIVTLQQIKATPFFSHLLSIIYMPVYFTRKYD